MNIPGTNILTMAAVADSLFYVGQKFSCFDDLENCKKEYEMSNFCNLTMRDAKTLQSMMKYAPKKAARAKKKLRYYSLRLCCTYGGKKFKKQGEGKRETESRKVDCGMCVRLILSDDGESLDVVEFSANHSNHTVSSEAYFQLPQQRRLDQSDLEHAETLISARTNSKLVQQHIQNLTGKVILLKDIANIGYKLRQHSLPNTLKEVLKQLNEHVDCLGLGFDESVLDSPWSRFGYMTDGNVLQNEATNATASISRVDDSAPTKGTSKLSQAAKYRKARNLTDSIASLCSEPGMTIFERRCEVLQQLCDSWSKGEEVKLVGNVGTVSEIGGALVVKDEPRNMEIFEEEFFEDVQDGEALVADVELNEEEPVAASMSVDKSGSVETETQLSGVSKMDTFAAMQMPPAMRKRGWPKGSETAVIGLANKKQKTVKILVHRNPELQ